MKKLWLIIPALVLMLGGCASKNIYTPRQIKGTLNYSGRLPAPIVEVTREGAVLKNGQIITARDGLLDLKLPKGFAYLGEDGERIIAAADDGRLIILSKKDGKKLFSESFEEAVASASVKGDLLAMVLANNTLVLHDLRLNEMIYKEPLPPAPALDARMANPVFLNDLIVFPSLDGRLLVMQSDKKVVLRDIAISDKPLFNNVIYLKVIHNTMIAATGSKVISINPKTIQTMVVGVKDVIYTDEGVYLFTKGGRVIWTDPFLRIKRELKFPFAIFSAVSLGKNLYGIEKSGYLIRIDKTLQNYQVYQLPEKIRTKVFAYDDHLYFDDRYIVVK